MPIMKDGVFKEQKGDKYEFPQELVIIVGLDRGNRNTKVWVIFPDGTHISFIMPSIVAPGSYDQLQEMRQGITRESTPEKRDLVIAYGGIEYFAGWLAYKQIREATAGLGDELRYFSDEAVMCGLTAITAAIEEYETNFERLLKEHGYDEPKEEKDKVYFPKIKVMMVSSVPVGFYKTENTEAIKAKFGQVYSVDVNGKKRTFDIRYQETIMEGGGLDVLAAEMDGVDHSEDADNIALDGGEDTVDFTKVGPGDIYYQECATIHAGVEHIGQLVSASMQRDYKRGLARKERDAVLDAFVEFRRRKEEKGAASDEEIIEQVYPQIALDAVEATFVSKMKLHTWVEAARQRISRTIISKASALWGTAKKKVAPDIVRGHAFFVGGETYIIRDIIQEAIPQIIVPPFPEYANAKANCYYARAMAEEPVK